jgi:hypothetical protein
MTKKNKPTKNSAQSSLFIAHATNNGLLPLISNTFKFALNLNRTSKHSLLLARCAGVMRSLFLGSYTVLFVAMMSISRLLKWPLDAAACSAVSPFYLKKKLYKKKN